MASYQARQRDPLLDQNVQAMLQRRGKEVIGLALIALALAATLMLWTYSPEDPGWMVATEEPAQNMFGRFGAALASPSKRQRDPAHWPRPDNWRLPSSVSSASVGAAPPWSVRR